MLNTIGSVEMGARFEPDNGFGFGFSQDCLAMQRVTETTVEYRQEDYQGVLLNFGGFNRHSVEL